MKFEVLYAIIPLMACTSMTQEEPSCINNNVVVLTHNCKPPDQISLDQTKIWMEKVGDIFKEGNLSTIIKSVLNMEKALERTTFSERSVSITKDNLVAHLYNAKGNFKGLTIYANESKAASDDGQVMNSTVQVRLPQELLDHEENRTIVFCMITSPKWDGILSPQPLDILDSRMIGVSVSKTVTGLRDRINITVPLQQPTDGDKEPSCQFFNFSTETFYRDGCVTDWRKEKGQVFCSCDHLTYFAVLMVSSTISEKDQKILTYITLIGCSLSLVFLVVTVFMIFNRRGTVSDQTQKVHLNLALALILLNVHFLPSQRVAALSSSGPCIYIAVLLHYSLLATFTWTAIEGFHLYLLLVRVFNIYVRRYLLKLGLVGWGFPAVVVALILIIDRDVYQRVTLKSPGSNNTPMQMCYVSNEVVKALTTVCYFGVVFLFNLGMLAVTLRRILCLRSDHALDEKGRAKRNTFTVLGITCLLGITWGLVFFSFGQLPLPGLYLFCILNSLQGFFIFLWFCISKQQTSASQPSTGTHSTNTGDVSGYKG